MQDGKVIKMAQSTSINKVIIEGMEYIAKMTAGLSTGIFSTDNEYIDLQQSIIKDLIRQQVVKVQNVIGRYIIKKE